MDFLSDCFKLYSVFCIIGVTTFGGGYAMFPIMLRELHQKRGMVDEDTITDYFTMAQTLPGIIAANTAALIGYKRRGIAGALCAMLGVITPSIVVICIIAAFYSAFAEQPVVARIFRGINIAVAATIAATLARLAPKQLKSPFAIALAVVSFATCFILKISILYIVLASLLLISITAYVNTKRAVVHK